MHEFLERFLIHCLAEIAFQTRPGAVVRRILFHFAMGWVAALAACFAVLLTGHDVSDARWFALAGFLGYFGVAFLRFLLGPGRRRNRSQFE